MQAKWNKIEGVDKYWNPNPESLPTKYGYYLIWPLNFDSPRVARYWDERFIDGSSYYNYYTKYWAELDMDNPNEL